MLGLGNDGALFVDFDNVIPRTFRLGVFSDYQFWNPDDTKWEDVQEEDRPLVTVTNPPFFADKWTHVCFTWKDINSTKDKLATARLYLNGELQGTIHRPIKITWDPQEIATMLGLSYIGDMDELRIYEKELNEEQVQALFDLQR